MGEKVASDDDGTGLFDAPVRTRPVQNDQLADFVQQQPLTAALVALVVGYLLGKIT
jgi:hypothetical protein